MFSHLGHVLRSPAMAGFARSGYDPVVAAPEEVRARERSSARSKTGSFMGQVQRSESLRTPIRRRSGMRSSS